MSSNTTYSFRTTTDTDKQYVKTGEKQRINGFIQPDFQYSVLGKLILYRLTEDRDVKILVTSKGKTTGTGKTTLAIILANWINKARNALFDTHYSWSAEDYSFMDVWEYLESYRNANPGDPLITDELEYMTDRRRSMSTTNVKFSQAWSMLRYKNVVTIGTAPHLSDLDKRTVETSDIWLNVTQKGRANSYYMTMDDFTWDTEQKRMKIRGYKETIRWKPIPDDPDYQWLKNQKEDLGVPGIDDQDRVTEDDLKQKEKSLKTNVARELLRHKYNNDLELAQREIAEISGWSQQKVSKIKKTMEDNDQLNT